MQKWGNRVIALIRKLAQSPGEHRAEIVPVLTGKPTDLPSAPDVYGAENDWIESNDPRIVHFGEYQLAVCRVPANLDPGEVGRRVRLLSTRRDDGWLLTPEALEELCTEDSGRPRIVVLNYPSNPTGSTFKNEQLRAIAQVGYRFFAERLALSVVPRVGIGYGEYRVWATDRDDAAGQAAAQYSRDVLAPTPLVIDLELSLGVGF